MEYKELNQLLSNLDIAMSEREDMYIENGGEVTAETEAKEEEVFALRELLKGDGLNLLGEWLKSKEDKKATLKAERDYITRQIASIDETIDFIKSKIAIVMDRLEIAKTDKGSRGYYFSRINSTTTSVNKDILNDRYKDSIERMIREELGIPSYVGFTLTASSTMAQAAGLHPGDEGIFTTTTKDSVRFVKPRAKKEE